MVYAALDVPILRDCIDESLCSSMRRELRGALLVSERSTFCIHPPGSTQNSILVVYSHISIPDLYVSLGPVTDSCVRNNVYPDYFPLRFRYKTNSGRIPSGILQDSLWNSSYTWTKSVSFMSDTCTSRFYKKTPKFFSTSTGSFPCYSMCFDARFLLDMLEEKLKIPVKLDSEWRNILNIVKLKDPPPSGGGSASAADPYIKKNFLWKNMGDELLSTRTQISFAEIDFSSFRSSPPQAGGQSCTRSRLWWRSAAAG